MKVITEEIEREELAWREDLYSSDRKFAEYYNVSRIQLYFLDYVLSLNDFFYLVNIIIHYVSPFICL